MTENSAGDSVAAPLGGDPGSNPQPEPDATTNHAEGAEASGGPVETGQDQQQTESAEGDPKPADKADDGEPRKREGGFQRTIRQQQQQIERLIEVVERLTGKPDGTQQPQRESTPEDAPPDPRDTSKYPLGDHDPQYIEDRTYHRIRQAQAAERQRESEQKVVAEIGDSIRSFEDRAAKLEDSIPGLADSIAAAKDERSGLPFNRAMSFAVLDLDNGPQVVHYLNHHRDEAARIYRMSPIQAAREIGRIAAKLPDAPARRQQSAAPPPPKEVAGGQSKVATFDPFKFKGDADEAEHENWKAWRARQG